MKPTQDCEGPGGGWGGQGGACSTRGFGGKAETKSTVI